jgi:ankyrin repeat protein
MHHKSHRTAGLKSSAAQTQQGITEFLKQYRSTESEEELQKAQHQIERKELRQEVQDPNCSWRRKLELNHADYRRDDLDEVQNITYTIEQVLGGFGLALKAPFEAVGKPSRRGTRTASISGRSRSIVSGTSGGFSKQENAVKATAQNLGIGQETLRLIQNRPLLKQQALLRRIQLGWELQAFAIRAFHDHPPLHRAILVNDHDSLVRLLSLGASAEQGSNVGEQLSAFQTAVISGNLDATRLFLQAGADINFCFNSESITIRKGLRAQFLEITKIQQQIDVLKVKMSNSVDGEEVAFKNQLLRLRQNQLLLEKQTQQQLERKLAVESDQAKLNARSPLVLACFAKNTALIHLLLAKGSEREVGLPPYMNDAGAATSEQTQAKRNEPLKLYQWCQDHFKLGARLLQDDDPPVSLAEYIKEPLYGVFLAWIGHLQHGGRDREETDVRTEAQAEGLKAESQVQMSLEELIEGFKRFGLWPSEMKLKKLAVLGAGSDPADSISDNGLHKIFLTSLYNLMATKKHLSAEEDEELGSGSHHAASSDAGGRSELNWDDFESIWKRKLEKLFFSALQLEHGVGGPDGAYAKKDKARLKELAYEAERQFRTIAAVLMLHRRSKSEEQLSVYDLQKFFRQHPLRLKCLNIDDSELDVLEKELQDIADDRQGPIQIISKSFSVPINGAVALSGKGETASRRPAPAAWFKCRKSKPDKLDDVEWDKQAQVEQLMLGYENFRWVIEVVCRENLGGMSVGEFSRLVFLEKAVELNVHQHRPASFRNLQNNEAHSHHHPRHTKADHLIPPNVSAVKLWGDIWGLVCVFKRGRGGERGREAREGERETETEKEKETETESAASIEVGHEYQNP